MNQENWEEVDVVNGDIQAEIIRGMLEAQGVSVQLSQEGAGHAMGLSIGLLGETRVLVPSSQKDFALQVLHDYYSGEYLTEEDFDAEQEPKESENEEASE